MDIKQTQQELLDELDLFPDWTERYEYVIGMGRKLPAMEDSLKTDDRLIQGCQSRVWLNSRYEDGRMWFDADSDSVITKGLIALFIRVFSGHTPEEIVAADLEFVEKTGLREHLAPTRANALNLMALQMKQAALSHCAGKNE